MVTCWRCGVEWDNTGYVGSAPCEDCQYEVPGNWRGGGQEQVRGHWIPDPSLPASIAALHARYMLDTEIAKELGIHPQTVRRYKKKLGLGSNVTKNAKLQEQRQALGRELHKHRWGGK